MTDPSARLRLISGHRSNGRTGRSQTAPVHPASMERPACRVLAVASGKGGVGKTNVAANLAICLGRQGRRVLLLDGDGGLANVDLLLGVIPRYTLEHVLSGEKALHEVIVESYAGVKLVPAASGVEELANLDDFRRECLLRSLSAIESEIDLIVIDAGSGIGRTVTGLALAADDVLVVTTPEPTAYSDAYALIKVLCRAGARRPPRIVINMAHSSGEARGVFRRIRKVSEQFLNLTPEDWGFIPVDPAVGLAVRNQEPFLLTAPDSPAARGIERLARCVIEAGDDPGATQGIYDRLKEAQAG